MWARVIEVMLGCWLAMSPFVFGHRPDVRVLWITDFACAAAIIVFALLSFAPALRRAHLGSLAVAAWLVGTGYAWGPAPAHQNHIIVGLLLAMLAIVPSQADLPHPSWRERWSRHTPRPS